MVSSILKANKIYNWLITKNVKIQFYIIYAIHDFVTCARVCGYITINIYVTSFFELYGL
jgi:hypothetical protein